MNSKELLIYKKKLKLNDIQREILIGALLGDATMLKKKVKNKSGLFNPYVKFEQKISSKEYIDHLYFVFKDWVGLPPLIRNIDYGKQTFRQSIWFKTYSHPSFTYYYNQFYRSSGKKIIPLTLIKKITPRSLAYWYMDGGSFNKRDQAFMLHTQGFSYTNLVDVVNLLSSKYSLHLSLHKDGCNWKLYIKKESTITFLNLIRPYVLPCFYYKIIL